MDWDDDVPLERNVLSDGIRTRLLRNGLDSVTDDEESAIFWVNTNVWNEGEMHCEVSWRASNCNLPEEWNGISLDWMSREHDEIKTTDLESNKQTPLEIVDWNCNREMLDVELWNENKDLFEFDREVTVLNPFFGKFPTGYVGKWNKIQ